MHGRMMDTPLLITDIMRFAQRMYPEREVVSITCDEGLHRSSYGEVFARAAQLAHALREAGIGQGDRVATLAWNDHRHLELYYAVSCMGAVLHTVNPRLFPEQIEYIVQHAEDRILFVDPLVLPALLPLLAKFDKLERVIVMSDAAHLPEAARGRFGDFESFIAGRPREFDWPALDERTASALCYTSGTTGHPKGVLYSHRSTVLHTMACGLPDAMGASNRDTILAVVPLFHANAWGLPYTAPMVGAKLVFPGPKMGDAPTLVALLQNEGVTYAAGVPTVWTALLAELARTGTKLTTLKRTLVGGSAVPLSMIREFDRTQGVEVQQGWGMTEMSPLGTVGSLPYDMQELRGEELYAVRARQGRTPFGVEMKIVDDEGKELPWDGKSAGELKVRGPWVCSGYYGLEKSAGHDAEGWFDTGDIATIDPRGFLQITDRAKDVIKSGGEWISSVDLENCACGAPDVLMAAAIGVKHPKWEERPLLLIVPKPGGAPQREAVLAHLGEHFAKWQLPDDVIFVESLPMTATGKLNKRALRERFGDHLLRAAAGG
jgi:fatty-acyl-CoA synthase